MSGVQHPVWREGLQRLVTVDAPGPGQEWVVTVPTVPEGIWWRIKGIAYQFTTSAVAGARQPRVIYKASAERGQRSGAWFGDFGGSTTQGASLSSLASWYELLPPGAPPAFGTSFHFDVALPFDVRLQPGWSVGSQTENMDAADQYSGIVLLVQEMIYVPPVDFITGEIQSTGNAIIAAIKANHSACAFAVAAGNPVGSPT